MSDREVFTKACMALAHGFARRANELEADRSSGITHVGDPTAAPINTPWSRAHVQLRIDILTDQAEAFALAPKYFK